MQHVSCILKLVSTGGKGDDPVKGRYLQVCSEVGSAAYFLQPVGMFPDAAEGLHISRRVHLGRVAGEEFNPVGGCRRHQIHHEMLVIIALIFLPGDAGEHGAVLHVMSVNDRIVVGKV